MGIKNSKYYIVAGNVKNRNFISESNTDVNKLILK